jgi:hypothetical protein
VACQTIDPGRVTIHRLNAVEYDNSVRDLLGDTTQPGTGFPDDAGGANFDNNADVLSTSPLLFQKLDDAAEALANTALAAGSATRARIITCDPTKVGDASCAGTVMRAFARKAWRRPPTDTELSRLVAFVPLARSNGDGFDQGIALGVQAVLLSPSFMFRPELDPDPTATAPRLLDAMKSPRACRTSSGRASPTTRSPPPPTRVNWATSLRYRRRRRGCWPTPRPQPWCRTWAGSGSGSTSSPGSAPTPRCSRRSTPRWPRR